jgi:hypothetical protein
VVRWIQVAAPGSTSEPEDPAPTLQLSAAKPAAARASTGSSSSNTGPTVLSIIALVVAAGALGLAVVTRAKAART